VPFDDVRLEDVARAAGIGRSSLLYHFGSKDKLYRQVVRNAFVQFRGLVGQAMASGLSQPDLVVEIGRQMGTFNRERSGVMGVIIRELMNPGGPARDVVEAEFVPLVEVVEAIARPGMERGVLSGMPPRELIMTLIAGQAVRVLAGDLGRKLWGDQDSTQLIVENILIN